MTYQGRCRGLKTAYSEQIGNRSCFPSRGGQTLSPEAPTSASKNLAPVETLNVLQNYSIDFGTRGYGPCSKAHNRACPTLLRNMTFIALERLQRLYDKGRCSRLSKHANYLKALHIEVQLLEIYADKFTNGICNSLAFYLNTSSFTGTKFHFE